MSSSIRWVLIISLALNLVLVTALGTWAVAHQWQLRTDPNVLPGLPSPRVLMRHLEEPERERLRASLRSEADTFRAAARAASEARDDVEIALLAEPFDRDALLTALDRVRHHAGGMAEGAQRAIVSLAEGMDHAGRERLVRALRAQHKHGHHERHERLERRERRESEGRDRAPRERHDSSEREDGPEREGRLRE